MVNISLTPLFLAESEEGEDGNEGEEGNEEERYEFTEEDIIIEETPPEVKVKFRKNIFVFVKLFYISFLLLSSFKKRLLTLILRDHLNSFMPESEQNTVNNDVDCRM